MPSAHYDWFLSHFDAVKKEPDGMLCFCPVHEAGGDHKPSLLVGENDVDGKILLHCRSVGCSNESIVSAVGLEMKDLWPPDTRPKDRSGSVSATATKVRQEVVATYDYTTKDGGMIFQKQRLEPGTEGRSKDFKIRKPKKGGGWEYKLGKCEKPLFNLPVVTRAKPDVPILIVEGEKCVRRLSDLGFVATCNYEGGGKWHKRYNETLRDRYVFVIPDNDEVGETHWRKVSENLIGIAKAVCRIDLPDAEKAWGPDDWLDPEKGGHDVQELVALLHAAEPVESVEDDRAEAAEAVKEQANASDDDLLTGHRKTLSELGLSYVGELEGGSVLMFSRFCAKFATVQDVSRLSYSKFLQIVGPRGELFVHQSSEDIPGQYRFKDVVKSIALVASVTPAKDEIFGAGIWPGENGEAYVVDRGAVLTYHEAGHCELSVDPHHGGNLYDVGIKKSWTELDTLKAHLEQLGAADRAKIAGDLEKLFRHWKFDGDGQNDVYPRIIVGMVLASFVQTLWEWRPQVFLIGKPNSGKSLMMRTISQIFGQELAILSSGSTAAGVRLKIGTSAKVAMCDELEKSRSRRDLLEMIRASGRGDNVIRGTSSQQTNEFTLRQIFWCSSTESGLSDEADQSRFLTLEIDHTPQMEKPRPEELWRIGQRALAVALKSFVQARVFVARLTENRPDGFSSRVCESFAVPIAMYVAAMGGGLGDATQLHLRALELVAEDVGEVESDSEELLGEICRAVVPISGGKRASIIEMIERHDFEPEFRDRLRHFGIKLEADRSGVSIHWKSVLPLLGENWKGRRLNQILSRIPGGEKRRARYGNRVLRSIFIPYSELPIETENEDFR